VSAIRDQADESKQDETLTKGAIMWRITYAILENGVFIDVTGWSLIPREIDTQWGPRRVVEVRREYFDRPTEPADV